MKIDMTGMLCDLCFCQNDNCFGEEYCKSCSFASRFLPRHDLSENAVECYKKILTAMNR